MKRNLELLKQMLLTVEEAEHIVVFSEDSLPEGVDCTFDEVRYNFKLLLDYNLIIGKETNTSVYLTRLTWSGHDFLDDAKNKTVWNAAKKAGENLSFTAFQEVVKELAKVAAGVLLKSSFQSMGLPVL